MEEIFMQTQKRRKNASDVRRRVRPRFFDQVGIKPCMHLVEKKHFFTKSNLPKLWTTSWNISKLVFSKSFLCVKNWLNLSEIKFLWRRPIFIKTFFLKILIFRILYLLKLYPMFVIHNFDKSEDDKIWWKNAYFH